MTNYVEPDSLHCTDLFGLCEQLDQQSVDMILCDLPYGILGNVGWDNQIDIPCMWQAFKRVIKPGGAIVLTATMLFAVDLINANRKQFRYDMIWDKKRTVGFLNAKRMPLRVHELILVFCDRSSPYNPQMRPSERARVKTRYVGKLSVYSTARSAGRSVYTQRYPTSILRVASPYILSNHPWSEKVAHSTQKPVALFDALIRTYTAPGDLVLDPCIGSGTTALSCIRSGRHYIGGDISQDYIDMAKQRIAQADPYADREVEGGVQRNLFSQNGKGE